MIEELKKEAADIEASRKKLLELNDLYYSDIRFLLHALKEGILLS